MAAAGSAGCAPGGRELLDALGCRLGLAVAGLDWKSAVLPEEKMRG